MSCVPRRPARRSLRATLVIASAFAVGAASLPRSAAAADCWSPPVDAPVVDPYREPACTWCPGNRGIEYGTRDGDRVRSVSTGEVTFAGTIAGTRHVVIRLAEGLRVTYGNLRDVVWRIGDVVTRGSTVGIAAGPVHLGVRDGDRYVDPAPFIGVLRGVVRLIPTDGSPPAPAPPPRLVCASPRVA